MDIEVLQHRLLEKRLEIEARLVTVDVAHKRCSVASEVAAIVAQEGFWSLQAPIQRVATENVHIPYSTALEPLCYPTVEKIAAAVHETLK